MRPSPDQVEVLDSINQPMARVSLVSGTSTGKTMLMGRICVWFLLCHPLAEYQGKVEIGCNVFISGVNIKTVLEGTLKEIHDARSAMYQSEYAWINNYWDVSATKATVKGYEAQWFISSMALQVGKSVGIAGKHRMNMLILVDEASGVSDDHFNVITGTANQEGNKIMMASQGTRNTGFFFNTHHGLSKANGGVWDAIRLSSERSPFVSDAWLADRIFESGGRDSVEYRIRCLGEFAEDTDANLLTRAQVQEAFKPRKIIQDDEPYGLVILSDVGMGEYRDDSVAVVAKVIGDADSGPDARRVEYLSIPLCTNTKNELDFAGELEALFGSISNATLYVDSGGVGSAVCRLLERAGVPVVRVSWGAPCFRKEYKDRYFNLRACAMVRFRDAVRQGRAVLPQGLDKKMVEKITLQASRLPYFFTSSGTLRYQIEAKDVMLKNGIKSPDLIDAMSFIFLEGATYIPQSGNSLRDMSKNAVLDEMNQALEDALKGIDGLGDLAELADLPE